MLSPLENEHCIKGLFFDEKTRMYSYQYADGSLGGLTLTEYYDAESLPLN